jgi:hypothetical protein
VFTVKAWKAICWIIKIVCGLFLTTVFGAMVIFDVRKRPPILPKELKISDLVKHLCLAPVTL